MKKPIQFFNREHYLQHPTSPAKCWGCGKSWAECGSGDKMRKIFRDMTGQTWPGSMICPVQEDFTNLGLDTDQVPAGLSLCLGCTIDYMLTYNRLLKELQGA
jgi:hypothetical protein